MQFKSLKSKILVLAGILVTVALISTIAISTIQAVTMAKTAARSQAEELGKDYGNQIRAELEASMGVARTLANSLEGIRQNGNPNRADVDVIMKALIEKNTQLLGVWTCWEPNAFDGMDTQYANQPGTDASGRFIPYWYRTDGVIRLDPLVDYDKPGAGDYYLLAKQSGQEVILNPYSYEIAGKQVMMTSMVVPIQYNGKVVGVAGVDMTLDTLSSMILGIKPYETGYAALISNNGTVIAHPDAAQVGKDLGSTQDRIDAKKAILAGKPFTVTSLSKSLNTEVFRTYEPLTVGKTKTPWSISINIPTAKMMAEANKLRNTAIAIAAVSIALILAALAWLAGSIVGPIRKVTAALKAAAAGNLDAELHIESKDEIGELAAAYGVIIQSIQDVTEETKTMAGAIETGALKSRADEGKYSGGWREIISGINTVATRLCGYIDEVPAITMTIDREFNVLYMNKAGLAVSDISFENALSSKCYDIFKTGDCKTSSCGTSMAMKDGRNHKRETIAQPLGQPIDIVYDALPIKNQEGIVTGCLEMVVDQTEIRNAARLQEEQMLIQAEAARIMEKQSEYQSHEVNKLLSTINGLAEGHLDFNLSPEPSDDETHAIFETFGHIYDNLNGMTQSIKSYIDELSETLAEMSDRNFDLEITREYKGDFMEMKHSLNDIIETFNRMLSEINISAAQIATGSVQVSGAAQTLSSGTTQQASSIQQVTAAMSEVAEKARDNALNAAKASTLVTDVRSNAERGNSQMQDMLAAMSEINTASASISKIIKVIDEIAFQTNILALNAAVEAARAGEHGKGFAVVAEEVRNLAARSAGAAKETTALIEDSIRKVESGTQIASGTSEALDRIVSGIAETAHLAEEIASASNEQATAVTQINHGINLISQVVQTNSATAEESAAASEEMTSQAEVLSNLTASFQLKDQATHSPFKTIGSEPHKGASVRRMTPAARTRPESEEIAINLTDRRF